MDGAWFPTRGIPQKLARGFKPYNGQGGVIDYHPLYKDFFIVAPSYAARPRSVESVLLKRGVISPLPDGQQYDFLWEMRFRADVEEAAWYGAFGLKLLFDNLMFGVLVTHEQNIVLYNNDEWGRILSLMDTHLAKYAMIHKDWTFIARYAENRFNTQLAAAEYDAATGRVEARLEGKSSMPLKLFVFTEEDGNIRQRYQETEAFEGRGTVAFAVETGAAVAA
jgi:PAS domain-containing protein